MSEFKEVGVGIIGAGWMGHVHARAFARIRHHFPALGIAPRVLAVADSVAANAADFQARHNVETVYSDWRDLVADPRVQIISVTAPNSLHAEIGVAVAAAGKHLWIEKPVGLSYADAKAVADAARAAGVKTCVGFNYRQVPAVPKAREIIASGQIGRITHARVHLFTDYAAHPGGTLSWRYEFAQGGHGVLGDLASHGIDLARFLLGDFERLVADTATFIDKRPVAVAGASHYAVGDLNDPKTEYGPVENEDYVSAMVRTKNDVLVVLESSRVAVGDQNNYGFEVHGTKGIVRWDFRRSDELQVASGDDYQNMPTRTVFSGPGDGNYGPFQPGAGIAMSYDDTKVIECFGLLSAIYDGQTWAPTIADAVASAAAIEAIIESAETGAWVSVQS
jgi:predicted dehydrogenase